MDNFTEKMKAAECMTDLELLDFFIDECTSFIDPRIYRHISNRGLSWIIKTGLTNSREENRAIVRARLASTGRYIGHPEIEHIAAVVDRIKATQKEISTVDPTDPKRLIELAARLSSLSEEVANFYK